MRTDKDKFITSGMIAEAILGLDTDREGVFSASCLANAQNVILLDEMRADAGGLEEAWAYIHAGTGVPYIALSLYCKEDSDASADNFWAERLVEFTLDIADNRMMVSQIDLVDLMRRMPGEEEADDE